MIVDTIDNFCCYEGIAEGFKAVSAFLDKTELESLQPGKIEIDGKRIFAIVTDKVLSDRLPAWEVHDRYADIHLIISGHERIGYFPRSKAENVPQVPEETDGVTFAGPDGTYYELTDGEFMILLPQDIHMPNVRGTGDDHSKKILFKVIVDHG